jgi:putative phosphoesterase
MPSKAQHLKIGLISDTHMPDRWKKLPQAVSDTFSGVDLILHAGDVGELWVLDELSQLAPVVAVHGNDETNEATRALPYHQLIAVEGQRLLLTHSHHPNRDDEMASRKNDSWHHQIQRRVNMAKEHGASVIVHGHTHVAMFIQYDGVWVINPGAIASGNYHMRQTLQTIACLQFGNDGKPIVEYTNLNQPDQPFVPEVDLDGGYALAHNKVSASILEPSHNQQWQFLRDEILGIAPLQYMNIIRPLAHHVWSGEKQFVSAQEFAMALAESSDTPVSVREKIITSPLFSAKQT